MGVYIKGMKMPKSCDKCPIMMFEDTNCVPELFCGCPIVFKAHPQGQDHRPHYCPLIEIQSHGRLIDADAAYEQFLNLMDTQGAINPCQLGTILVDATTIIEAEGE